MMSRDSERTVQLNTIFDVLKDPRRRYILYALQEADESAVPFETLVEEVRKNEASDKVEAELPPRQGVRTELVHFHLPKLESVGLLERDPRTGDVQFYGDTLLEEWIEQTSQFELE
jgi:DNA-binding transcriptional ArsR family regulator